MKGVVAGGFLRPAAPGVIGLQDVLLRIGDDEVDDHGRTADHARRGAGEEILRSHCAHERQFHVRMRVDATWQDVGSAGVDHLGAAGGLQVFADRHDLVLFGQDVSPERMVRCDHGAAFDQDRHDG